MFRSFPIAAVLFALVAVRCAVAAEVAFEKTSGGYAIKLDGKPFTEYLTKSGNKPVLWPIIGPTGKAMTRTYPLAESTGENKDHIHHRSLWFTHGNVNGIDFWMEGDKAGSIVHREFVEPASAAANKIVTINDWLDPSGKKVCEDRRTFEFGTDGDARFIDATIVIKASEGDLKFGDTKEGSFGVRVHEDVKVDAKKADPKKGGRIVNSEGQTDGTAWGQPAAWVDYHGPIDGETLGVAILNHPSSFRFPTTWHVRTYGLFAANPFGWSDFTKKAKNGEYTLPAGETLTLRYRVLFHTGDEKTAKIAAAFERYAKEK